MDARFIMSKFLDHIKTRFKKIVVVDTEFQFDSSISYVNKPICAVYKDLSTGQVLKIWDHDQTNLAQHHFDFDETLFVCHYAIAEVGYFIAQLMGRPPWIFDTWTEYSKLYKNRRPSLSLVNAATAYEYPHPTSGAEKEHYRQMCIIQNSWTKAEQEKILKYCEGDVLMTEHVFYEVLKDLEKICGNNYDLLLEQAMARGQAIACVAKSQRNGIPLDTPAVDDFNTHWKDVKDAVIQRFNVDLDLWDSDNKFVNKKFYNLIDKLDLLPEWPLTPKGKLKINNDTLKDFAGTFPEIKKLKTIFNLLNAAKLAEYTFSEDGRYRPTGGFKMFGTHTGRCAPSSKSIFGTAKWGRNFMKPSYGNALVYLDYKSEEPFISARLSGDKKLEEAYNSGDVYLHTAKLAGLAPDNATDKTHGEIRNVFKIIVLATNYGMGVRSLTKSLSKYNINASEAAGLLRKYKEVYHVYFEWVEQRTNHAEMYGYISTSMGWDRHFAENSFINPRSLMNWSIQSESAEVLRNALIRLTDAHIKVCAMVHDAFLIECPLPELEDQIRIAKRCMIEGARYIVGGTIQVTHETHLSNFKQTGKDGKPNKDQEIFDLIFEEINKHKIRSGAVAKHGQEGQY